MSFTVHARRVRDGALPHAHRRSALRSAVVLFRPFGFQATWSYLGTVGDLDRDGDALLRALAKVESSRRAGIAERAAFAERRRAEKLTLHRRCPSAADVAYFRGPRWPGPDGHAAAVHEVARLWRVQAGAAAATTEGEPAALDRALCDHIAAYLAAGGRLDRHRRELIVQCLPGLHRWASLEHGMAGAGAYPYVRRLVGMAEVILNDPGEPPRRL
ncbi:hypothetical protein ABZZ20_19405 [Streptomyces sp. NPDC006430]|uniref:hypothetical protein n=1 Tax=Streptomyces sp. NPDC006430 TaxID=3154299 RepID=UPI0033A605DA